MRARMKEVVVHRQAEHKSGIGGVSFGFLLHCHLHCSLIDFLQLGRRLFAAVGG